LPVLNAGTGERYCRVAVGPHGARSGGFGRDGRTPNCPDGSLSLASGQLFGFLPAPPSRSRRAAVRVKKSLPMRNDWRLLLTIKTLLPSSSVLAPERSSISNVHSGRIVDRRVAAISRDGRARVGSRRLRFAQCARRVDPHALHAGPLLLAASQLQQHTIGPARVDCRRAYDRSVTGRVVHGRLGRAHPRYDLRSRRARHAALAQYKTCGTDPPPCDTFRGDAVDSGGHATLRINQHSGTSAAGQIVTSTDPAQFPIGPFSIRSAPKGMLMLDPSPRGESPLCGPKTPISACPY